MELTNQKASNEHSVNEHQLFYLWDPGFYVINKFQHSFTTLILNKALWLVKAINQSLIANMNCHFHFPALNGSKIFFSSGVVSFARIFDDGQSIACADRNKVDIFDVKSGNRMLTLSGLHEADVTSVEIVYDDCLESSAAETTRDQYSKFFLTVTV